VNTTEPTKFENDTLVKLLRDAPAHVPGDPPRVIPAGDVVYIVRPTLGGYIVSDGEHQAFASDIGGLEAVDV
jgi:hypothetical protein